MLDKKITKDDFAWVDNPHQKGEHLFRFGNGRVYNLFRDYPHELSEDEKEIFDEVNPYWAEFFKE